MRIVFNDKFALHTKGLDIVKVMLGLEWYCVAWNGWVESGEARLCAIR